MFKTLRSSLLGLIVLPLAAQGTGFSVDGGLLLGNDSLKKATNGSSGFHVGVDYGTRVLGTQVPVRFGVTFATMPGKTTNGGPTPYSWVSGQDGGGADIVSEGILAGNALKTSLTLFQLHGDVFIDTALPELKVFAGLSLNSYSMKKDGNETALVPAQGVGESDDAYAAHLDALNAAAILDSKNHFPVRDVKGLKMGLRLGVSYAFSEHFSAELLIQQTELAGKDLQDPLVRRGGINPSWFELGLRWHF